jgi:hypothetical protein
MLASFGVSMRTEIVGLMGNGVTGRLAKRLADRVQRSDLPLTAQVVSWMDLVDLCREVDDSLVAADATCDDATALHEAVVGLAISCAGRLIDQIGATDADISESGQTQESLSASLEMLRIFHSSRHSDLPVGEVEAVRQRLFNATA